VCLDILVSFFSVAVLFLFVVFVMGHRHRTLEVKWNPSLPVCLYVYVSVCLVHLCVLH
jgi:NADH:ubiquinone oxidoreductase subunit 6 (subunit J)